MKTLAILLFVLTSLSVNGGWFGSSIEGAFGLEFGKVYPKNIKVTKKSPYLDKYETEQGYDNKLLRIIGSSKRCGSSYGHIKDVLFDKYGETQWYMDPINEYNVYTWNDKGREVQVRCHFYGFKGDSLVLIYKDMRAIEKDQNDRRRRQLLETDSSGL